MVQKNQKDYLVMFAAFAGLMVAISVIVEILF